MRSSLRTFVQLAQEVAGGVVFRRMSQYLLKRYDGLGGVAAAGKGMRQIKARIVVAGVKLNGRSKLLDGFSGTTRGRKRGTIQVVCD